MNISSWEDVIFRVEQATNEVYQAPGDLSQFTSSSLQRIGNSLQVASHAATSLALELETQLNGFVKVKSAMESKAYRAKPVVAAVLSCPGGIRDALKNVVRLTVRAWIERGHFVLDDVSVCKTAEDTTSVQFCSEEAKRCLDALGKVTSYVSWICCAEEGIGIGSKSCSFLIRDVLLAEMENNTFDPSNFIASSSRKKTSSAKQAYWKRMKLWFILSLDDDFAAPLRSTLANELKLSKQLRVLAC